MAVVSGNGKYVGRRRFLGVSANGNAPNAALRTAENLGVRIRGMGNWTRRTGDAARGGDASPEAARGRQFLG
jgi:hypothetical protein